MTERRFVLVDFTHMSREGKAAHKVAYYQNARGWID